MLGEGCCSSEKGDLGGSPWVNIHIQVTPLLDLNQSESLDEDAGFCQELAPANEKTEVILALSQNIEEQKASQRQQEKFKHLSKEKSFCRMGIHSPFHI